MHEDKDCKKGDCYYGTEDPIVVTCYGTSSNKMHADDLVNKFIEKRQCRKLRQYGYD
jgi:hypothetical protein